MVEVEQRAVCPLEQDALALAERAIDEQRRIGDVGPQALRAGLAALGELFELERLGTVDALEPEVLLRERHLDLLPQDLGIEQVLDANPDSKSLVRIGRPDASTGRADPELAEPPFAGLVDGAVPGHDYVRVPRQPHPVDGDAPPGEVVELGDQLLGVDDATGADDALLLGHDASGKVAELEGLAVHLDRVPGVRSAVVAADDVRVLGEQVDDLALALVSPLGPDDHGRGHGPKCASRPGPPADRRDAHLLVSGSRSAGGRVSGRGRCGGRGCGGRGHTSPSPRRR